MRGLSLNGTYPFLNFPIHQVSPAYIILKENSWRGRGGGGGTQKEIYLVLTVRPLTVIHGQPIGSGQLHSGVVLWKFAFHCCTELKSNGKRINVVHNFKTLEVRFARRQRYGTSLRDLFQQTTNRVITTFSIAHAFSTPITLRRFSCSELDGLYILKKRPHAFLIVFKEQFFLDFEMNRFKNRSGTSRKPARLMLSSFITLRISG